MRNSLILLNPFWKTKQKQSTSLFWLNSYAFKKNNYRGSFVKIIHDLRSLDVFDWLTEDDYRAAVEKFKFYNGGI